MADLVTMDALFGSDPAAADNSLAEASPPGATTAQATSPPASPDVSARIADLEGLVQRHRSEQQRWREQVTGSQRENERLRTEIQEIRTRLATAPPPAAAPTPTRRVSLVEANEKFLLDNDKSLLQEYERQQAETAQAPKPSITLDDVRGLLAETEQKRDTRSAAERTRSGLEQALLSRHPELSNPAKHPAFVTAMGTEYQALASDPATQYKYAPDPNAMFTDPGTGITYDMRLLLDAGALVQAKQPPPAPVPTLPGGGTPPSSNQPKGPGLPRYLVEGPNAVLADPAIQKAMAELGAGTTIKEQAAYLLKNASPVAKQHWMKGEVF